jgi:hypothetical protein
VEDATSEQLLAFLRFTPAIFAAHYATAADQAALRAQLRAAGATPTEICQLAATSWRGGTAEIIGSIGDEPMQILAEDRSIWLGGRLLTSPLLRRALAEGGHR